MVPSRSIHLLCFHILSKYNHKRQSGLLGFYVMDLNKYASDYLLLLNAHLGRVNAASHWLDPIFKSATGSQLDFNLYFNRFILTHEQAFLHFSSARMFSLLHLIPSFPPGVTYVYLHPSFHHLWPASLCLLRKDVPTSWWWGWCAQGWWAALLALYLFHVIQVKMIDKAVYGVSWRTGRADTPYAEATALIVAVWGSITSSGTCSTCLTPLSTILPLH